MALKRTLHKNGDRTVKKEREFNADAGCDVEVIYRWSKSWDTGSIDFVRYQTKEQEPDVGKRVVPDRESGPEIDKPRFEMLWNDAEDEAEEPDAT